MPAPDPRLPGRYAATVEDGDGYYWCQDHPEQPLISESEADGDEGRISDAIRAHDREQHEGDPVV